MKYSTVSFSILMTIVMNSVDSGALHVDTGTGPPAGTTTSVCVCACACVRACMCACVCLHVTMLHKCAVLLSRDPLTLPPAIPHISRR